MSAWTRENQELALREGWGIWTVDGVPEIQAWGEDPLDHFEPGDDEAALMHVESRAAAGSSLHREAIMEITINGDYAETTA